MVQLDIQDLSNFRNKFKDKKIIFCSGSFDLTHAGHIIFFEKCREFGDILVVGVGGDELIKHRKGYNRPILNEKIRLKIIDSLKPVDFSFIDNISNIKTPLGLLDVAFEQLKPDIYVINEDAFDINYRKDIAEKYNVKLIVLKRWCPNEFENISASKIIEKIKKIS